MASMQGYVDGAMKTMEARIQERLEAMQRQMQERLDSMESRINTIMVDLAKTKDGDHKI